MVVEKMSDSQRGKVKNQSSSKTTWRRRDVMLCYTVRGLEEPKTQFYIHNSVNLELSTKLKALKEAEEPKMRCASSSSPSLLRQPMNFWRGLKSQTQRKKKPSILKVVRHFLGLRKPNGRCRPASNQNNLSCHHISTPMTSRLRTVIPWQAKMHVLFIRVGQTCLLWARFGPQQFCYLGFVLPTPASSVCAICVKLICPPHSCVVYSGCSGFSDNLKNLRVKWILKNWNKIN